MTADSLTVEGRGSEETRKRSLFDRVFAHLSRESSTGQFIAEIDGLRFVAIISVICYHLKGFTVRTLGVDWRADPLAMLVDEGNFGVQLFFVISGFIIAYPFAEKLLQGRPGVSLGKYLKRRLTRLEPPYIFNLLLIFVLMLLVKGASFGDLWPHLVASVGYMHNVIYGEASLVNGVAWSLEIECQFYLLAPLMVSAFRIASTTRRRLVLVSAIAISAALTLFPFADSARFRLSLLNFLCYFLTGFLLADVHIVSWHGKPTQSFRWDVISGLCWIAVAGLLFSPWMLHALLPAAVFGAYLGAFRGKIANAIFRNRVVYTIGGMCYTIYLYHFLVLAVFAPLALDLLPLEGLPVWAVLIVMFAVVVPPTILVCSLFFVAMEKPFMRKNWHLELRDRLLLATGK